MKELLIAICDDDETALIAIRGTLAGILDKMNVPFSIDTFNLPVELEKAIEKGNYDIALLDIEMPGTDGIVLGQMIKDKKSAVEIIYVSNREDLVFDTFKVHPFGFVRKSRFLKDISEVVQLYINTHKPETGSDMISFKHHGSEVILHVKKIMYIESARDYQYIYQSDDVAPIKLRTSMEVIFMQLEPLGFIRIHKGYIVNFIYIRRIDTTDITLTNGVKLPLSRRNIEQARMKYMHLCRTSGFVRIE